MHDDIVEVTIAAMLEMIAALQVLCERVNTARLDPRTYDRLDHLVTAMLADAEKLCAFSSSLEECGSPDEKDQTHLAHYVDLAQALADTRRATRLLLDRLRPLIPEHSAAVETLARVAAASKSQPKQ